MTKTPFIRIFAWSLLLAAPVFAVLPPDAGARPQQIRSEYARRAQKYDQRQVERQAQSVLAYEQTRSDIFTPPWLRAGAQTAALTGIDTSMTQAAEKASKRNHRLFASIVLLILIAAAAGWVRYATREIDNQYR